LFLDEVILSKLYTFQESKNNNIKLTPQNRIFMLHRYQTFISIEEKYYKQKILANSLTQIIQKLENMNIPPKKQIKVTLHPHTNLTPPLFNHRTLDYFLLTYP